MPAFKYDELQSCNGKKKYRSHLKSYRATVLIVHATTGSTVLRFNIKSNPALIKMLLLKNASCSLPSLHLRCVYRSTPKVHFSGIKDSTVICFPIASSESEHAILSGGLRNSSWAKVSYKSTLLTPTDDAKEATEVFWKKLCQLPLRYLLLPRINI